MKNWFEHNSSAGWTAVEASEDGLYGVTVLAPIASGDKPRVVKTVAMPGVQLDAEALAGLSKKISQPGCPWVLTLGHKEYNILTVPEPAVLPAELEQSLRWSISTTIDTPVDEVNIAWMQIPSVKQLPNRSKQLYVMVAKKEVVNRYNAIFQQAKIPLQAIDVRETAQRNIAALAGIPEEGEALLLLGKQGIQFSITLNGELYLDRFAEEPFYHSVQTGSDAKARAAERITLLLQRSLDFVSRSLPFIDIKRIHVAPMPDHLDLRELIAQNLSVPLETLDPATLFDLSLTPELAQEENKALYFSVLGSALRFMKTRQHINLQTRQKSGYDSTWVAPAAFGLALLSLLGFAGMRQTEVATAQKAEAASAQQLQQAKAKLEAPKPQSDILGSEIAALRPQADAAQRILAQAGNLGSLNGYAEYFHSLATISEEGLWLNNVSVDQAGKSISVSGRALQKESVMRYAQRLNARFAEYGVQFTALEMTPETVGKQGDPKAQITAVMFKLY